MSYTIRNQRIMTQTIMQKCQYCMAKILYIFQLWYWKNTFFYIPEQNTVNLLLFASVLFLRYLYGRSYHKYKTPGICLSHAFWTC